MKKKDIFSQVLQTRRQLYFCKYSSHHHLFHHLCLFTEGDHDDGTGGGQAGQAVPSLLDFPHEGHQGCKDCVQDVSTDCPLSIIGYILNTRCCVPVNIPLFPLSTCPAPELVSTHHLLPIINVLCSGDIFS